MTPSSRSGTTRGLWALAALLLHSTALAVPVETVSEGADLQRFLPAVDPLGAFSAGSGEVLRPRGWAVGLHADYARNPLVLREQGERVASTLANRLAVHLHGAFALLPYLELGAGLPVVAFQNGDDPRVPGLAAQAVGDLELQPRFRLLEQRRHGVFLAVAPGVRIPLGGARSFAGGSTLTFAPRASVARHFGRAFLTGDAWLVLRPEVQVLRYTTLGSELGLRLAGGVRVGGDTELVLEADGALAFATLAQGPLGNPLEVVGGVRHHVSERLALEAGVGVGVLSAPGVPDVRVLLGFHYGSGLRRGERARCPRVVDGATELVETAERDGDTDGLDDACDACPAAGEQRNGYQDADGCPDPDRDGDGIIDGLDECVAAAGTGPSGCPDGDGDGLQDRADECPGQAGARPAGCPDTDGDGLLDREDECPAEPGAPPAGCPDTDGDGLLDRRDRCPAHAEDKDGFEDDDGCPDPDHDRDGIPEPPDRCPTEKETINGVDDEDGCPDKGKAVVVVRKEKIEILDKIHFDFDKDTIQPRSHGLLAQVALTIRAHPEIRRVRVEGHTDDVGGKAHNDDLSQRRAEAVVRFLVGQGLEAERLVARGYGFDRPLAPNSSAKNRAVNRRVEFHIVFDGVPEVP